MNRLGAVFLLEKLPHLLDEIRRRVVVPPLNVKSERRGPGLLVARLVDLAVIEHRQQHLIAALQGAIGMENGRIGRGGLGQPRQQRGLRQRELAQVLAKIEFRRRFKTESAVTQTHLVRVHGENLRLREAALDLNRQQNLLELSPEALFGRQEEHPAELLGQGACSLRLAPLEQVRGSRPENADDVAGVAADHVAGRGRRAADRVPGG